jgi:YD repeat-containing protein
MHPLPLPTAMSAPLTRSQRSFTAFALFAAMALAPLAAQALLGLPDTCPPNTTCRPPDKKPPIWDPNPPPNDGPKQCTPRGGGDTGCGGGGPAALSGGVGGGVQVGGGNPINLISGNKHQEEVDLAALPGVLGLEFTRRYNSSGSQAGMTGALWRHSYETVLYEAGNQIQIIQADGRRLHFARVPGQALCVGADHSQGQVRIETGPKGQLTYHWRWSDGRVLTFSGGRNGGYPLQRIQAATGEAVQLSYSPLGDLLEVKDPQGRRLRFIYGKAPSGRSSLAAVDTPLGRIEYRQDAEGRLTEVRHLARKTTGEGFEPSPHLVRQYHYEAQHQNGHSYALTGISQSGKDLGDGKQAQRIATYAYNREGRAILTVRGKPAERDALGQLKAGTGVEQLDIRYLSQPGLREGSAGKNAGKDGEVRPLSFGEVELSNALGHKSRLKSAVIGGQYRLVEFRGAGCASCGPANRSYGYDSEGRLIRSTQLDAQGQPLVSDLHKLDGEGRLIERSRVVYRAGRAQEPEWLQRLAYADIKYRDGSVAVAQQAHEIRRPSVVPGKEAITRIERNAQGQITRVSESAWSPIDAEGREVTTAIERSTSYRYAQVGGHSVLMEIDGPLANGPKGDPSDSDVTRLVWNAKGLLVNVFNQPGGASTALAYDAGTGMVSQAKNDIGASTRWTYSAVGSALLPLRIAQVGADGKVQRQQLLRYDAAGQPLELSQGAVDAGGPQAPSQRLYFDAAGRLVVRANNQGQLERFAYNPESQLIEAGQFGAGQALLETQGFDEQGRLASMSVSQGPSVQLSYDDAGRPATLTDSLGRTTQLIGGKPRSSDALPRVRTLLDDWGRPPHRPARRRRQPRRLRLRRRRAHCRTARARRSKQRCRTANHPLALPRPPARAPRAPHPKRAVPA